MKSKNTVYASIVAILAGFLLFASISEAVGRTTAERTGTARTGQTSTQSQLSMTQSQTQSQSSSSSSTATSSSSSSASVSQDTEIDVDVKVETDDDDKKSGSRRKTSSKSDKSEVVVKRRLPAAGTGTNILVGLAVLALIGAAVGYKKYSKVA